MASRQNSGNVHNYVSISNKTGVTVVCAGKGSTVNGVDMKTVKKNNATDIKKTNPYECSRCRCVCASSAKLQMHITHLCPSTPVPCFGCRQLIKRSELENHLCPSTVSSLPPPSPSSPPPTATHGTHGGHNNPMYTFTHSSPGVYSQVTIDQASLNGGAKIVNAGHGAVFHL